MVWCPGPEVIKVSKEAKIRNRFNQVPHLTQDTIWESDKNTIKHNIQENQDASHLPAGDSKAAMNRQESMTNTINKLKKTIINFFHAQLS